MAVGASLSQEQVARILELRYMDGLSASATAAVIGCGFELVRKLAPGRPGKIENAQLREAFERSGKSASDIARSMGWVYGGKADSSRVRRTLGLAMDMGRSRSLRRMIDAETAALMAEAIGVMPWEVGA